MRYIDTETLEYPLLEIDIRNRNPNISFPIPFQAPSKYQLVENTSPPTYTMMTHKLVETSPKKKNGVYFRTWSIVELTQSEKEEQSRLQISRFSEALTSFLDATAQSRRYDNRITCALRAGYTGPFQAEGQAFASWMDQCNALAYTFLSEFQNGTRPLPNDPQELIALLPPMVWPT